MSVGKKIKQLKKHHNTGRVPMHPGDFSQPPSTLHRHVALASLIITSCPSRAETPDPLSLNNSCRSTIPSALTDAGFQILSLGYIFP